MEVLANPLGLVDVLYDQAGSPQGADAGDWGIGQHLGRLLREGLQVPELLASTVDRIPQNGLCRVVGLVQDMLDPECYLGAFQQEDGRWRTTKFRDYLASESIHIRPHTLCDRKPLYCVRPPGESSWTAEHQAVPASAPLPAAVQAGKRPRPEETDSDMQPADIIEAAGTGKAARLKSSQQKQTPGSKLTPPSPEEGDCIVYLYGADEGFKVNEVIEVLGVLSRVPELAAFPDSAEASGEDAEVLEYDTSGLLPTSQVPRVHALLARKLTAQDRAGALVFKGPSELQMRAGELRQQAVQLLSHALGGDSLAAEYVLLQLLSRIHTRAGEQVLGGLSFNLVQGPTMQQQQQASASSQADSSHGQLSPMGQTLRSAAAQLVPYSLGMAIGPSQLNAVKLVPRQDHTGRRLAKGSLQMAEGTHLLLDETLMRPGQLNPNGVANLQALKGVLESKQVDYDFEFYKLPMPLDVPVTILSQGKALLQASVDAVLPLQSTSTAGPAGMSEALRKADLPGIRSYLAHMRAADFTLEPGSTQWLEDGIVSASRLLGKQRDEKILHVWLTLARLLALSHGETTLSKDRWDQMRSMEHRRAERNRVQIKRVQVA